MNIQESDFGFTIAERGFLVFFGKRQAQAENLQTLFPDLNMVRVRQTHSDIVISSDIRGMKIEPLTEADAHYSFESQKALCISTADCTPIMIYGHQPRPFIASIHAGWRGVANQICLKTCQRLLKENCDLSSAKVLIGPHILKDSFEVDEDVKDLLLKSAYLDFVSKDNFIFAKQNKKFNIDLSLIIKSQLLHIGISSENIFELYIDTKTNVDFHSYRRDKESSGRQLSFITLTK